MNGRCNVIRMNLARVVHEIWSQWITHMITEGRFNANGEFTIPEDKIRKWSRQSNTKFDDLTPSQQTNLYFQADKLVILVEEDKVRVEFEAAAEAMIESLEQGYRPTLYLTELTEDEQEGMDFDDIDYTVYRAAWFDGKGLISLDGKLVQEHDDMAKLIIAMNTIKPLEEWD